MLVQLPEVQGALGTWDFIPQQQQATFVECSLPGSCVLLFVDCLQAMNAPKEKLPESQPLLSKTLEDAPQKP